VVFRATALEVPLTALPIVVRLPPTLLSTATDFLLAVVQVGLWHFKHHPKHSYSSISSARGPQ
jgi:hypothetical protein